jgi:hypothetical protein
LASVNPGEPLPTQPVIVTVLFAESALVCASAGAAIIAAIPQSTNVFMAPPRSFTRAKEAPLRTAQIFFLAGLKPALQ